MKIMLTANKRLAEDLNATATVEAVYGGQIIRGSIVTLDHHTPEFAGCKAPCNQKVPILKEGNILLSHLDGDALGGVLALIGQKPDIPELWDAVEFIDIHGEHHINELTERQQELFNSYQCLIPFVRPTEKIEDISELIFQLANKIKQVDAPASIENGRIWRAKKEEAIENCLFEECPTYRAFITNGVPCGASYYSKKYGVIVPATITLNNKFRSISIGMEDGGKKLSAVDLVRQLWGEEAGGHPGIAGSPRNHEWSEETLKKEFEKAIKLVKSLLK